MQSIYVQYNLINGCTDCPTTLIQAEDYDTPPPLNLGSRRKKVRYCRSLPHCRSCQQQSG